MPEIFLYAELLIHIRQLTLHASLHTEKNEHTKILLSSDKKVVTALHEGESASIYLPTQISGTANLTFPTKRQTELSTKLQIDDLHQLQEAISAAPGVQVPWSAWALGKDVSFCCKACNQTILEPGRISEWRDLPSENWAELMDLWFCHKPHEGHEDETRAAASKGFSAESKVGVSPGVGLVDMVSFLLHPDDCCGAQMPDPSRASISSIFCTECDSFIGSAKDLDEGYRLYKSRLAIRHRSESEPEKFDSAVFVAAQLLQLVESSVARRVVVHDTADSGLLCWIFNPDIYYSSSRRGPTVHRAIKVFYKEIDDPMGTLDEHSNTYEELALPKEEVFQLKQTLFDSAQMLPTSARTFQDWQVGLLDRYEQDPSGQGAMDQNALNHQAPEKIELFHLPEGWSELYV